MKAILVATDLSPKDEKLLTRALSLCRRAGAKMHVLHVHHAVRVPGMADNVQEERNDIRKHISNLIRNHPDNIHVEYDIHIADGGRIYEKIDQCAHHVCADLVVVGKSKSCENTPDFVLSTTERLLLEADYPVLIVSKDNRGDYKNVVVRARSEHVIIEAVNLTASSKRSGSLIIDGFSNKSFNGVGLFARLRQAYGNRKEDRLRKELKAFYDGQISFLKNGKRTLAKFLETLSETDVDVFAMNPFYEGLSPHKPDLAFRDVLINPPCDLLMIGRK